VNDECVRFQRSHCKNEFCTSESKKKVEANVAMSAKNTGDNLSKQKKDNMKMGII